MNLAIDELQSIQTSIFFNKLYHADNNSITFIFNKFEENLKMEEENITEYGEKELVVSLSYKYKKYKSFFLKQTIDSAKSNTSFYFVNVLPLFNEQKATISSISNLNMQAIIQKNENLDMMVNHIYKNLSIVLTVCFLISITFMFNFPLLIIRPIKGITEKIQEIVHNNYEGKIDIPKTGDFKELIITFNNLIEKIKEKYQPIVVEKEVIRKEVSVGNLQILGKIRDLLGSISSLLSSISQSDKNEFLKNQSEKIKLIEDNLADLIKQEYKIL
jgi:methyl-accepting chemotaxis protein